MDKKLRDRIRQVTASDEARKADFIELLRLVDAHYDRIEATITQSVNTQAFATTRTPVDAVFDSVTEALFSVGSNGTIRVCNKICARYFGIPKDELIGMPLVELIPDVANTSLDEFLEPFMADLDDTHVDTTGGEVRARGRNGAGRPWAIGIEMPDRAARSVSRVIELDDLSLATSGDYRNFYEHDGRYYSHTIDPRTGAPVFHDLAAVSVVHAATMEADAWATALLVLGPVDGPALARELGLTALFQRRTDDGVAEKMTGDFEALLRERQAR